MTLSFLYVSRIVTGASGLHSSPYVVLYRDFWGQRKNSCPPSAKSCFGLAPKLSNVSYGWRVQLRHSYKLQ